jgi:hypothetical protein
MEVPPTQNPRGAASSLNLQLAIHVLCVQCAVALHPLFQKFEFDLLEIVAR